MGKIFVYHGSYTEIKKPSIIKGRFTKDFGNGFYCTAIREQAERWAGRFKTPVVNIYSFIINEKLRILDFIVNCRYGKKHDYDIVIGAMADDQIYNYISDYIDGAITREQFWALAKFRYPTHQINFCSKEALKCLTFVKAEELN